MNPIRKQRFERGTRVQVSPPGWFSYSEGRVLETTVSDFAGTMVVVRLDSGSKVAYPPELLHRTDEGE